MISLLSEKLECCMARSIFLYVESSFLQVIFQFFSNPGCNRDVSVKNIRHSAKQTCSLLWIAR